MELSMDDIALVLGARDLEILLLKKQLRELTADVEKDSGEED